MAKGKNRPAELPPPEDPYRNMWWYWLLSHSLIHGMTVTLITLLIFPQYKDLALILGISEAYLHYTIDRLKSKGLTNMDVDQSLHILCKILWTLIVLRRSLG